MKNLLLILSGPAGVGKSTLAERLLNEDKNITRVITATSRTIRNGETNNVDYIFLDEKTFEEKIENNEFYEWAKVHGRYYGTLKSSVQSGFDSGKDLLLLIDVQGAKTWDDLSKEDAFLKGKLLSIFVMPESLKVLEERLGIRATDDKSEIERRLETAKFEITQAKYFQKIINSSTKHADFESLKKLYSEFKNKKS